MKTFAPGDRVVAINTDIGLPLFKVDTNLLGTFDFPDGALRSDVIYHVRGVENGQGGKQGLFISGMRVLWFNEEIPWSASRFRKVDSLKGHVPMKRRRQTGRAQPAPGSALAAIGARCS